MLFPVARLREAALPATCLAPDRIYLAGAITLFSSESRPIARENSLLQTQKIPYWGANRTISAERLRLADEEQHPICGQHYIAHGERNQAVSDFVVS